MRKIIYSLLLLLSISFLHTAETKRFYSKRYCFYVDLPQGFHVKYENGILVFESSFSKTYFHTITFKGFLKCYRYAKTLGRGIIISSKNEVSFAHSRILRATRGGYIIYRRAENKLIHIAVLKKEHRIYIFKTFIDENNLKKFKSFLKSIRLFLPEEKNYEGMDGGKIIRLTLFSDNTFRFNNFNSNRSEIYSGFYKYDGNTLVLKSSYKEIKSENVSRKIAEQKIITLIKHSENEIKYSSVILKLSTFTF
jgi:hypothetical protein